MTVEGAERRMRRRERKLAPFGLAALTVNNYYWCCRSEGVPDGH
jgi:hypothetical protein